MSSFKKSAAAGVDNTTRRKWDRDEYASKAAEREAEEEAANAPKPAYSGAIVVREALKQRDYTVDLTSRLGKTQVDVQSMIKNLRRLCFLLCSGNLSHRDLSFLALH